MSVNPSLRLAAVATLLAAINACSTGASGGAATDAVPAQAPVSRIRVNGTDVGALGIQLWSFRDLARGGTGAMLRTTRGMGISHVETAGLYGMRAAQLADSLRAAGLRATSMHVSYEDLAQRPQQVIADAKALGARYVGTAWYPHQNGFTEADARRAIADFNRFGRTLRDAGLTFFYHNHGYEPVPFGDGTLLDLVIRETDPQLVKFEMDVLWTYLPGQDPAALIRKYPGRFRLMHIKDMRPGIARGSLSGGLPAEQQAAIGEGQVRWAELIDAAWRDGMELFYLEDETTDPMANVPKSVAYLAGMRR